MPHIPANLGGILQNGPDELTVDMGFAGSMATVLDRAAREFTSPFSAIVWHQFHGAAARLPLGSTAFGRREPHLMVQLISLWEDGESKSNARSP
ncbi:hypothetical protein [Streptomyces sp. NEAU-YJ-81]|uniref:hypothetical protein n=1 Tax=Streptomyces sp. NEAU-YJ-81 TaxID=2820288 RepID=UPI001FBACD0F|nr:hypothetical protein [Streptomyces sp. NEAU-YJ-81]